MPVAHEDDAERAVRAGLEPWPPSRRWVKGSRCRGWQCGGIVTGEVAVTLGATAQGMVAGDAVNTAARVQSAAEPGRVWVDEPTSLRRCAVTFPTPVSTAEGQGAPVRLWAAGLVVDQVGGGQRVDGLEAPFTGRDADLRLVKDLFHGTEETHRPRLVVLDGEAGVGKSRLAWEFEKYSMGRRPHPVAPGPVSVLRRRGRVLGLGRGDAHWVRPAQADTGDVVAERLDAGLAEMVPDVADRDWLRPRLAVLLAPAVPRLGRRTCSWPGRRF